MIICYIVQMFLIIVQTQLLVQIRLQTHMRGNFRKGNKGKNSANNKQVQINFFLIDAQKIGLEIPYIYCVQQIRNYVRDVGEGVWNFEDKCWVISRESYSKVVQKIQDHFFKINNEQQSNQKIIKVNPIEDFVFKGQKILKQELSQISITNLKPYSNICLRYNSVETNIQPESLPFYDKLFDFQKQSLLFGIKKHGRMLLADQMGVGKTIQSLAVAYIYKHQWPLLIICPPSLKINWQNEIKRWYPDIQQHHIQLIHNSKTPFRVNVSIMIISYDLAWRMKDMFDHIKIVIADQAHYLKSSDSKRSQVLVPYLSTRKRVILLTGTPAFARPRQIFNLISIIRPNLFKNFKLFGNRYCQPKYNHWSHSYEYNGCKNVKQLHYLLKDNVMIRRLKADVLKQLPEKNRQKVYMQTDSTVVRNIKQVLQKNNIQKMETFFSECINSANSFEEQMVDKREEIMQAYRMSGMAKIKAVREYIDQILSNGIKILVFAHHMKVLDEIQTELKSKKHKFIRIDGTVSQTVRADNVQKFQNDPQILVALLSITAAGVGITLTAASTVIFAELFWTPALMIQAEDRAHRVGQKNSVNCHYLIGENTLDQMLYKFLEKKVLNVSSFIDGQSKDLNFEQLQKGQKGKFSKKQQSSFPVVPKRMSFGSNLMPEIVYQKDNMYPKDTSQQSQITDISDTSYVKPSRKRVPSSTLNYFVTKKAVDPKQISEMSELKYVQSEKKSEKNYQRRSNSVFNDYWQTQPKEENYSNSYDDVQKVEKKRDDCAKKLVSMVKKSHDGQIDSDEQFESYLEVYIKSKTQSNSNSNRQKQLQKTQSPTNTFKSPNSKQVSPSFSIKTQTQSRTQTQSVSREHGEQEDIQI